jgi:hypothetical protein
MPGLAQVPRSLITEACDCFVTIPTVTTSISATTTATEYLRQLLDVTTTTSTATSTISVPVVATDLVGFNLLGAYHDSACSVDFGFPIELGFVSYLDPTDATSALAYCAYLCLNEGQVSILMPANVPVTEVCGSFLVQYYPDGDPPYFASGGWVCMTYYNAI